MGLLKRLLTEEPMFNRKDMPQIKTGDLRTALEKIQRSGVEITKGKIDPKRLKPSQIDIDLDKAKQIRKKGNFHKPLIISKDNYIVDGHHRWKAATLADKATVEFFRLNLNMKTSIKLYKAIARTV